MQTSVWVVGNDKETTAAVLAVSFYACVFRSVSLALRTYFCPQLIPEGRKRP
jgi:hypothetical protein